MSAPLVRRCVGLQQSNRLLLQCQGDDGLGPQPHQPAHVLY